MGAQGSVILDFGAFPGTSDAQVAVTGQAAILASSLIEAWMLPVATADHSVDEQILEQVEIYARDLVAGTGFTIHGVSRSSGDTRIYGKFNVGWVWN